MTYTTEQINALLLKSDEREEQIDEIKTAIINGTYDILETCKLATIFNINPATYGNLVEHVTKQTFSLPNPKNTSYGDATIRDQIGLEIKTSFTRPNGSLTMRQIRFRKHIDYFLVVNYDNYNVPRGNLTEEFLSMELEERNYGRIQFYLIPVGAMQNLVKRFSSYTHGTKENLGKISEGDLNDEYSLDYNAYTNSSGKSYTVWEHLQEFAHTEETLAVALQEIYDNTDGLYEI